jgi:hypothetical protein
MALPRSATSIGFPDFSKFHEATARKDRAINQTDDQLVGHNGLGRAGIDVRHLLVETEDLLRYPGG